MKRSDVEFVVTVARVLDAGRRRRESEEKLKDWFANSELHLKRWAEQYDKFQQSIQRVTLDIRELETKLAGTLPAAKRARYQGWHAEGLETKVSLEERCVKLAAKMQDLENRMDKAGVPSRGNDSYNRTRLQSRSDYLSLFVSPSRKTALPKASVPRLRAKPLSRPRPLGKKG